MNKVWLKYSDEKGRRYYPQIDSIRGLSFLGIFLFHAVHPHFANSLIGSFGSYIYHQLPLALDVFFILSSFLLTSNGLEEYQKNGNFSFGKYFLRRVLRIWPLYYLLLFFSFLIFPLVAEKAGFSMSLPAPSYYIFFISNFYTIDHVYFLRFLWTLSVEEQFYLILGICLRFFPKYLKGVFIFFIILSILFSIFSSDGNYFHTLTYLYDFAIGGIGAILFFRRHSCIKWLIHLSGWRKLLFYSYLPLHFTGFFIIGKTVDGNLDDLLNKYLFIIYILFFIIEQLINVKSSKFLERNRFFAFTGNISYGLYCFHGITITAVGIGIKHFHINISQYLVVAIIFFVNYLIAIASYIFFEKPFLNLKETVRRN